MGIISTKLRNSARGQPCMFAIPGICNHDPETVALCHIRDESKGLGNKANDYSAGFGCHACHEAIDQHKLSAEDELFYCLRALQRTWAVWIDRGLIVLPVDPETAKKRPKKKTVWPSRKLQSRNDLSRRNTLWQPLSHGEIDGE